MGQGTTTPAPNVTAGTAGSTTAPSTPSLTEQQAKAISMLLSQMGKGAPAVAGMNGQAQRYIPQTSTVQGGTRFNPQQLG